VTALERLRAKRFAVELTLFRHGESTANAEGLATGRADVPLSDVGRRQAAELAARLERRYDWAISSALERSRETLAIALRTGGIEVEQVLADPRLDERAMGDLEMKPQRVIPEIQAGKLDYRPQGGESYGELARRVLDFLIDLADSVAERPGGRLSTVICAHVGPIRMITGTLRGMKNSAEVMTQRFGNGEILRLAMTKLLWPAFLPDDHRPRNR
jgi:broad specificity phosphatase PhoE